VRLSRAAAARLAAAGASAGAAGSSSGLQLGLEGNYKLTTYDVFGDKNAWVVISQVMFRL
jgi:hypothetical protein